MSSTTIPPVGVAHAQDRSVNLRAMLDEMIKRGASDLHITAGDRPKLRIDGAITNSSVDLVLTPAKLTEEVTVKAEAPTVEQPALRAHELLEALGHGVEVAGELADLVAAARHRWADAGRQVARRQPLRRAAQVAEGRAQVAREHEAEEADHQGHDREPRHDDARVEQVDGARRMPQGHDHDSRLAVGCGHRPGE